MEPADTTTVRRRDKLTASQGAGSHGAREDDSSKTFYHVLSLTIALADCLISVAHMHLLYYTAQLTVNCVRSCFYSDRLAYRQSANQQ